MVTKEKRKHTVNTLDRIVTDGTIYYDDSTKGYENGGHRVFHDCWRAEINIDNMRFCHRSNDRDDCVAWLKAVRQRKIKPWDNKADWWRMEQKDDEVRIDEVIVSAAEEAMLLYDYHRTGDLTRINDYIVKRLLPHMTYYCCRTLHLSQERTMKGVRQAVALMLTRLAAGKPVLNFTSTLKRMLRVFKVRGNFFYYDRMPENVRLMVDGLNLDGLAEIYKVTKDKRI